jgi:hypothetical protein
VEGRPRRSFTIPELFLGLLSLAVAIVVTANIVSDTIHDARHVHDTISVTGSARKPIDSNLVKWSLTVTSEAATTPHAATRLSRESAAVQSYLRGAGIAKSEITPAVVTSEQVVTTLPHHRRLVSYRVAQELEVSTHQIDIVERAAQTLGSLLQRGIEVHAQPLEYLSTELTQAKLDALQAATEEAHRRAEILVKGLGGHLGAMRSSQLGVYQITPRDSTDVSDYGINDTTSRLKDVTAVVTATFAVSG